MQPGSGRKRKVADELSQNPNTKKARERRARLELDKVKIKVELTKNTNDSTVKYARKKLRKSTK